MWTSFTDMAVRWGLPAVILIFWYLHNQGQAKLFSEALELQNKQAQQMSEMIKLMVSQQGQQAEEHFAQTERMIEQLQYLTGLVGRVETMAGTNQFCPITRGESKPK